MHTIAVEVDDVTYERTELLARTRSQSIAHVAGELLADAVGRSEPGDPLTGMFADDPDTVDLMLAEVMRDREARNERFGHR